MYAILKGVAPEKTGGPNFLNGHKRDDSCPTVSVPRMLSARLLCRHLAQTKDIDRRPLDAGQSQRYSPARRAFLLSAMKATPATIFSRNFPYNVRCCKRDRPCSPSGVLQCSARQPQLTRKLRRGVGATPAVVSWAHGVVV